VWQEIENEVAVNQSGSIVVAKLINSSRPLEFLNHLGLAELILIGCWFIWWERRKLVHGEVIQFQVRAALSIATYITNYQRALKKTVKHAKDWKKPPEGILLLNIDASYKPERGEGGTGGVLRDANGTFIAAAYNYIEHVVDAPTAEVHALREGLLLA